ncbi:MAG: DUF1028 domain-containing protein [Gammaproteobacteria bacterium]|nr:DUF1028 domain-containing protein [Gammaproteobacteria bacterium]
MTFSITARCERTGMVGVAVSSSSVCVASRCAWARAGAGAVASQNVTDPALGQLGLELLARGYAAPAVIDMLVHAGSFPDYRQLAVVDAAGGTAHHSGAKTLGRHAVAEGAGCVAAGNILADQRVPAEMVAAFAAAPSAHLAERLVGALEAGLAAGGEEGDVRSAGVLIAASASWPVVDLRVDWDERPIARLRALWEVYAPQLDDYVTRALDPASAPAYGVPGDP